MFIIPFFLDSNPVWIGLPFRLEWTAVPFGLDCRSVWIGLSFRLDWTGVPFGLGLSSVLEEFRGLVFSMG